MSFRKDNLSILPAPHVAPRPFLPDESSDLKAPVLSEISVVNKS